AERDIARLDARAGRVAREVLAGRPHRLLEQVDGAVLRIVRRETAEERDAGEDRGDEGREQRIADHLAATEARLLVGGLESLDDSGARLIGATCRVALLDVLLVAHDRLGPMDRADTDSEERERDPETDVQVVRSDRGVFHVL